MALDRLTDQDIENLVSALLDVTAENPDMAFHLRFIMAQEKVLSPEKRYARSVVQQKNKWSQKLQNALKSAGVWPGYVPPESDTTKNQDNPAPSDPFSLIADRPAKASVPTVQEQLPTHIAPPAAFAQLYEAIRTDLKSEIVQEMTSVVEHQVNTQLRILMAAAEHLGEGATQIISEPRLQELRETLEPEVSIPRIFIIGLLPEQALILRRKLRGMRIDLRFWKNEANTKLTQYADWADQIYLMTNFVSHTHIHAINNYRKKIKYCNGAVSDLERQIRFGLTDSVS
jgi:hypothetical protein